MPVIRFTEFSSFTTKRIVEICRYHTSPLNNNTTSYDHDDKACDVPSNEMSCFCHDKKLWANFLSTNLIVGMLTNEKELSEANVYFISQSTAIFFTT